MNKKYWAVMRNGETVLTTVEADEAGLAYAIAQRNGWARVYTDDKITIVPLKRRAQAVQVSPHGRTEAREWEFASG